MRFSGAKLHAAREARSMGQHELAEAARKYGAGVNQASVSRHENGKEPSARNAIAYARALGVDVTSLYELDDDEEEAASMPATHESTALMSALQPFKPLVRLLHDALEVQA